MNWRSFHSLSGTYPTFFFLNLQASKTSSASIRSPLLFKFHTFKLPLPPHTKNTPGSNKNIQFCAVATDILELNTGNKQALAFYKFGLPPFFNLQNMN